MADGEGWRVLRPLAAWSTGAHLQLLAAGIAPAADGRGWIRPRVKADLAAWLLLRPQTDTGNILRLNGPTRLRNQQVSAKLPRSSLSGFHPRSFASGGHPAGRARMSMVDSAARTRVVAAAAAGLVVVVTHRRPTAERLQEFSFPQRPGRGAMPLRASFFEGSASYRSVAAGDLWLKYAHGQARLLL